jgi:hypothetical protein
LSRNEKTKQTVLFVWSRPNPGLGDNGRDNFIRNLRAASDKFVIANELQLVSSINCGNSVKKTLALLFIVVRSLIGKRSLQECLFDSVDAKRSLLTAVYNIKPCSVYFDSIRCSPLVRHLIESGYTGRIIVDFDDLLSERYKQYSRYTNYGFQLGYFSSIIGSQLSRLIEAFPLSGWILRRESMKLTQIENEIAKVVDIVLLSSEKESRTLISRIHGKKSTVTVLHQLFSVREEIVTPEQPFRFVFVGSDRQIQNAVVIDYLINLWELLKPDYPLYIYGRQRRHYKPIDNVFICGFETDFYKIYTSNSIAITWAVLPGGVKTKTLEALSFGIPVITNSIGIEGFTRSLAYSGISISDQNLIEILEDLDGNISKIVEASRRAQSILSGQYNLESFDKKVRAILLGEPK